jgi:hypothetical protein
VSVTVIQGGPLEVHVADAEPLGVDLGQPGPPGARGPAGAGQAFLFEQDTPSDLWTIAHNFGRLPIVTVYDMDGNLHPFVPALALDLNTIVLTPNPPLAGKAVLT